MASTANEFSSDPVLIPVPEPVSDPVIVEDPNTSTQSVAVAVAGPAAAVKDMDVIVVQDVSGSMQDQRRSVQTGVNEIIDELQTRYKEPCAHKATFCLITFSSHDRISVGPAVPVHDVAKLENLTCDGMTALWDTVAIAVAQMNEKSKGVPATTYVFTDGDNNDSRTHTQASVNEMIADNKKRNPTHSILFIGSDPSTKRNAEGMGLDRVHSIQHDSDNTPVAYEVCRRALERCVTGDTQSTEFNDDDIILSETPSATPSAPRCRSIPIPPLVDDRCQPPTGEETPLVDDSFHPPTGEETLRDGTFNDSQLEFASDDVPSNW
jgi:hypothetical protein